MCNRACYQGEPETLFGATSELFIERPRANTFNPMELRPKSRNYVIRQQDGKRAWDLMTWDVLGGQAAWPPTNERNLKLPQWRRLAEKLQNRCIIPLTEFAEFTPDKHDLSDGKLPLKGEMWFSVVGQPTFAVAGFWQRTAARPGFTMATCDANELVEPIHPKAMITILEPEDVDRWFGGAYADVLDLQRPYDASKTMVAGPLFPTRSISHARS